MLLSAMANHFSPDFCTSVCWKLQVSTHWQPLSSRTDKAWSIVLIPWKKNREMNRPKKKRNKLAGNLFRFPFGWSCLLLYIYILKYIIEEPEYITYIYMHIYKIDIDYPSTSNSSLQNKESFATSEVGTKTSSVWNIFSWESLIMFSILGQHLSKSKHDPMVMFWATRTKRQIKQSDAESQILPIHIQVVLTGALLLHHLFVTLHFF